jgi:hypothetical protein
LSAVLIIRDSIYQTTLTVTFRLSSSRFLEIGAFWL